MKDEALLRQIGANRDDDAPRAVYADMLQQRGDPRGEFIQLQLLAAQRKLTPDERKRHNALLKEHKQRWLGPFAGTSGDQIFERGFLVELSVNWERLDRIDPNAVEWLTLERALHPIPEMGPQFHRLREIVTNELEILEGSFPELRRIEIRGVQKASQWRKFSSSSLRLPQLRHLTVRATPAIVAQLLGSPIGKALETIHELESTGLLAKYAHAVRKSRLTRFSLCTSSLVRDGDSWTLEFGAPAAGDSLMVNVLSGLKPAGLSMRLTGKWSPMHLSWARESVEKMPLRELFRQAAEE